MAPAVRSREGAFCKKFLPEPFLKNFLYSPEPDFLAENVVPANEKNLWREAGV
jgi:hypothetical protein